MAIALIFTSATLACSMFNLDNNLMLAVSHGRFASQSSLRRRSALTCCGTTRDRACPHL